MSTSSIVDLVFLLLLVTFAGRGFWRGFSGELFSLVGSIGGVIVAWKTGPFIAEMMVPHFNFSPTVILAGAMVIIYILIALLAALLCRVVKAFLRITQLSFVDRIFGSIAGILKTAVIIIFVYFVCLVFSPLISTEWMNTSFAMKTAGSVWPQINKYVSDFEFSGQDTFDLPEIKTENPGAVSDDS